MSLLRSHGSSPRRAGRRAGRRVGVTALAVLAATGLTGWWLTPQDTHAAQQRVAVADDFDGDGRADLVVGAPHGTVSGQKQAGYLAVTYGSAKGTDPAHRTVVSRSTAGVPGAAKARERFGQSFSRGDLDGDGYGDLVIGTDLGTTGSVVLWGSADGLTGGTRIADYGTTPRIGDFDGDGKDDLALFADAEVAGDDPVTQEAALWKGPISREGAPSKRLDILDRSEWWGYGDDGAACEEDDSCVAGPHSVSGPVQGKAVGDVNGDDRDDIAVWEYEGDGVWGTHVMLGGADGFTRSDTVGAAGYVGGDSATDVGDVDGDGYDDVVLGSNDEDEKVTVVYGSASGPSDRTQRFDQSLPDFYGAQEKGDRLGSCVAVADVDGDGRAEIALGISGEDFSGLKDAGSVALLHGGDSGVTGEGSQVLHQNTKGVPGVAESGDEFGSACALLDTDGDGHRDLAVSAARENDQAGAVWSLKGTADGLTVTGARTFGPGDVGGPVTTARFGDLLG
ncbi:FG-GAP repeat protein [Streptomyces sp. NPDC005438]|uniref:FG-GAP repeat protein n=1 Tax=Streptomyces sp. NPDC005438 TaxID=3156880 RepID=UPI0033ADE625